MLVIVSLLGTALPKLLTAYALTAIGLVRLSPFFSRLLAVISRVFAGALSISTSLLEDLCASMIDGLLVYAYIIQFVLCRQVLI